MNKSHKTTEIRQKITEATKQYLMKQLGYDEFVDLIWHVGQPVWDSIIDEQMKKLQHYITRDDLEATAREAIVIAAKKVSNSETAFSYFRRWVKGYIKETIKKLAFPFSVRGETGYEIERISLNDDSDDDEDEATNLHDILFYHQAEFDEIEVNDLIEKLLNEKECKIVYLLLDGFSFNEIAIKLNMSLVDIEARIERIRKKLAKEVLR